MSIIASESGGKRNFKPAPAGRQAGVCDQVVDLGVQDTDWGQKRQVYLRWQVPSARVELEKDGETIDAPSVIGSVFTLSLHPKATLRQILEDWRGRPFTKDELAGFDITTVINKPCYLHIAHKQSEHTGRTFAQVRAVFPFDGDDPPLVEGKSVVYDADNQDNEYLLSKFIRSKIANAVAPVDEIPKAPMKGDGQEEVPF